VTVPRFYPGADATASWYPSIAGGGSLGRIEKLVLHTTEGESWFDYGSVGFGPHLTWNPHTARMRQHIPMNRTATALEDRSSTAVRENRDNVVQIEIIGRARNAPGFDDATLRALGRLVRWCSDVGGMPMTSTVSWRKFPMSGDSQRLSGPAYDDYRGVLGHQHVSGNSHGDPGLIDIRTILAYATGAAQPPKPAEWDGRTFPGADVFTDGSTHPAVTLLGQRLVAWGWAGYRTGPGVPWGPVDAAGCRWFQELQGWQGKLADGIPGPATWARLMANPPARDGDGLQRVAGPPISPGSVTTRYGVKGDWAAGWHTGDDFNGPGDDYGQAAHAVRAGKVVYVGRLPWDQKTGNAYGSRALLIQWDDRRGGKPVQALYAHLSKVAVGVGDRVHAGEKVGELGWSGNVRPDSRQGTHLHYEERVAPYRYGVDAVRPVYS
jgi:hypothetical protein